MKFLEAMRLLEQGETIKSCATNSLYKFQDGQLLECPIGNVWTRSVSFSPLEINGDWQVHIKKRSWLESQLSVFRMSNSKEEELFRKAYIIGAREVVENAIDRIREQANKQMGHDDMRFLGYRDCILILKNMIGEE